MTEGMRFGAGECPMCGCLMLLYGACELQDNHLFYPWECENCAGTGQEWYKLEFASHESLKDKDWAAIPED